MSSVVSSSVVFVPPQTSPLVNTPVEGSVATRVPSDNVPPNVSDQPVLNERKGNGRQLFTNAVTENDEAEVTEKFLPTPAPATRPSPEINIPTTFLAQLLGQQTDAAADTVTRQILLSNERLAELNAEDASQNNNPQTPANPVGAFDAILREAKQTAEENDISPSIELASPSNSQAALPGPTLQQPPIETPRPLAEIPQAPEQPRTEDLFTKVESGPTVLAPPPEPTVQPPLPEPTVIKPESERDEASAEPEETVPEVTLFAANSAQISAYEEAIRRVQTIEPLRTSFVSEAFNA